MVDDKVKAYNVSKGFKKGNRCSVVVIKVTDLVVVLLMIPLAFGSEMSSNFDRQMERLAYFRVPE